MNFLRVFAVAVLPLMAACATKKEMSRTADDEQPPTRNCPQVNELFKIVATDAMYELSPDATLKKLEKFLKVKNDDKPQSGSRHITFEPDGKWLHEAEMHYSFDGRKLQLNSATFYISSRCFADTQHTLQTATRFFGDSFDDFSFEGKEESIFRTWDRPEPDINSVRFFSLSAGVEPIHFRVVRDPAPDLEEGGDEDW